MICIVGDYRLIIDYFTYKLSKHNSYQTENAIRSLPNLLTHETKPVFIFVHPPKSGGSLIRVVLQHWCIATNKRCQEVSCVDQYGTLGELREMNVSELNRIDVFMGHVPYGTPNNLNLRRPIKYLTILRDPVRQAVSAFHFQRYLQHHLGGAFALQSVIRQLNNTFHLQATSTDYPNREYQLDHDRDAVISYLTKKHNALPNAKGCFSSFGASEGWIRIHNFSVQRLQSMDTQALINFADNVVNHAWKSNCTGSLSPLLIMTFQQFLTANLDLKSTWKEYRPQWDLGNNPTVCLFCCYHLWSNTSFEEVDKEQIAKCPRIRNDKTLSCALDNMKQIDLILITEKMQLSL